jgi:hypothetical protein
MRPFWTYTARLSGLSRNHGTAWLMCLRSRSGFNIAISPPPCPCQRIISRFTGQPSDPCLISNCRQFSRSLVSAAEQLGKQLAAGGACRAFAGSCGTGAFTCCQSGGEFCGFVMQPVRNSAGMVSISSGLSNLPLSPFLNRIYFTLSALFFGSGFCLPLCQRGSIVSIPLFPFQCPGCISLAGTKPRTGKAAPELTRPKAAPVLPEPVKNHAG